MDQSGFAEVDGECHRAGKGFSFIAYKNFFLKGSPSPVVIFAPKYGE